jgi:outer membrane cobalamin receptor
MRTRTLIICAAVLGASNFALGAQPGEPAQSSAKAAVVLPADAGKNVKPQKTTVSATTQTNTIVLTGSYIPAKINRNGRITDGPDNVIIIDRRTIEHSGASSVAQVLAREPGIRVRSH